MQQCLWHCAVSFFGKKWMCQGFWWTLSVLSYFKFLWVSFLVWLSLKNCNVATLMSLETRDAGASSPRCLRTVKNLLGFSVKSGGEEGRGVDFDPTLIRCWSNFLSKAPSSCLFWTFINETKPELSSKNTTCTVHFFISFLRTCCNSPR